MTDFLSLWANRHDEKCEEESYLNLACRCYVRWLEGRLGEAMALIRYDNPLGGCHRGGHIYEHEHEGCKWCDVIVLARVLLPPKGAE